MFSSASTADISELEIEVIKLYFKPFSDKGKSTRPRIPGTLKSLNEEVQKLLEKQVRWSGCYAEAVALIEAKVRKAYKVV